MTVYTVLNVVVLHVCFMLSKRYGFTDRLSSQACN